jgi:hypothetical protein
VFTMLPALALGLLMWQAPEPNGGGVRTGTLPKAWRTGGPNCMEAPDWEIHEYNPDFFILRESGCVNYEKPFLYLLFGKDKCFLIDTGAGHTNVAQMVSSLIDKWAAQNRREAPGLIVGHSHSHDDHTAGDGQFKERPNTTLVPLTVVSHIGRKILAGLTLVIVSSTCWRSPDMICSVWRITTVRRACCSRAIASIPAACTCATFRRL